MKKLVQFALIGFIGAAGLAASALPASAYIACDRNHDCWHVQDRFAYPRRAGITIHPDTWRWSRRSNYRWREHDGRGYWRGGAWITF